MATPPGAPTGCPTTVFPEVFGGGLDLLPNTFDIDFFVWDGNILFLRLFVLLGWM